MSVTSVPSTALNRYSHPVSFFISSMSSSLSKDEALEPMTAVLTENQLKLTHETRRKPIKKPFYKLWGDPSASVGLYFAKSRQHNRVKRGQNQNQINKGPVYEAKLSAGRRTLGVTSARTSVLYSQSRGHACGGIERCDWLAWRWAGLKGPTCGFWRGWNIKQFLEIQQNG